MITRARLLEVLKYHRRTGTFTWRVVSPKSRVKVGDLAGCINPGGYRQIRIDGRTYKAHRLVWLAETGEWPAGDLDHRFGVKDDNRFSRLREASKTLNARNRLTPMKNSKSCVLGVCFHRGKWQVSIGVGARQVAYLGRYSTKREAGAVSRAAKRQLHSEVFQ